VYDVWNRHRIRRTRHELHVAGRPNVMYTNPELFDRSDYLQQVSDNDVQFCMQQCTMRSSIPCDGDVFDICCEVMAEEGVSGPKTVQEAVDVYLLLRNKVAALYSSSRMRVIYHNWSAMKQRPHPQSVAEISHHSVLSGGRIRQYETSSGSRHKDTDQCL